MQGNLSWILGQGTKIPTCQGANKPTYPNQRSLQAATKSPHAAKKIPPSQKKKKKVFVIKSPYLFMETYKVWILLHRTLLPTDSLLETQINIRAGAEYSQWPIRLFLLLLLSRFSCVWLFTTPWTAAHQAPPSMGFSRQEYWSGVPLPSPIPIHLSRLYTSAC